MIVIVRTVKIMAFTSSSFILLVFSLFIAEKCRKYNTLTLMYLIPS